MAKSTYRPTPGESKLITFANEMYTSWYDGLVFITPVIAFEMRLLVERCRKNYYGIYEDRYDEVTGEEKYWPPLTEHLVETVVKETDIDTKNMVPYAANPAFSGVARVVRMLLWDKMKRMKMSSKLNDILRSTAIDGSKQLKCVKVWDEERKKWVRDMALPDFLNVLADPSADSIDDSAVLERAILSPQEAEKMKNAKPNGWKNLEYVAPQKDVAKVDTTISSGADNKTPAKMYEFWEVWGELPKDILTGNPKDADQTFYGHCVLSGLGKGKKGSGAVVHLIEESEYAEKRTKKPYKEVRFRKVPNRRPGRGVAESLFGAQLYLNVITGIRQMNGYILQNGLFKARTGSGITAETLSQIAAGGVIPVDRMEDIEQLNVQDHRAASYSDEDRIFAWAQRQTFANDQVRGEMTPTSASATGSIIQDRSAKSAFSLVQEDVALPIAEFFEEFIIPYLGDEYSAEEIVRITGTAMDFEEIDRAYVEQIVNEELVKWIQENMSIPKMSEYQAAIDKGLASLRKMGKNRHVKIWKDLFNDAVLQVEMAITNERVDTAVIIQNLKEILAVNQANPNSVYDNDKIVSHALSLMGLDTASYTKNYVPTALPSDRMNGGGAGAAPGAEVAAQRILGGAGAPNISRSSLSSPTPLASVPGTAAAANAQSPIRRLAGIGG